MNYEIIWDHERLILGQQLPQPGPTPIRPPAPAQGWQLLPGCYLARDIVREAGILLGAITAQLPHHHPQAVTKTLIDNLQAVLAVSGAESALPLASLVGEDGDNAIYLKQARQIAQAIVDWAKADASDESAAKRYAPADLAQLRHTSKCDQHRWTPATVHLLMGESGSTAVMQLYNEYLHQMVLLRDAMLPFANWEQVRLVRLTDNQDQDQEQDQAGMRYIEQARDRFLTQLLLKKLSHPDMVAFAAAVLLPKRTASLAIYGFQYAYGTVLPAALQHSPYHVAPSLMQWHPCRLRSEEDMEESVDTYFAYAWQDQDYTSVLSTVEAHPELFGMPVTSSQRNDLPSQTTAPTSEHLPLVGHLCVRRLDAVHAHLAIQVSATADGGSPVCIDLGQALRGQRYAYRLAGSLGQQVRGGTGTFGIHADGAQPLPDQTDAVSPPLLGVLPIAHLLHLPGLVGGERNGAYLLKTGGNALIQWMLLGKLLPQNVILSDRGAAQSLSAADAVGKQFGSKFILV